MVTTDPLPLVGEVQRRVRQAFPSGPKWPLADLLPMILDMSMTALVSFPSDFPFRPYLFSSFSHMAHSFRRLEAGP